MALRITARTTQANINNVATVSSDALDPNTANNSAAVATQVTK